MKLLPRLAFLLIIFSSQAATAQNYRTIKAGSEAYFTGANRNFQALVEDSIAVEGQDTLIFNHKQIRGTDDYCFTPDGASWIGKYCLIQPDGTNLYFNKNGDTIYVNTRATLNARWTLYHFSDGRTLRATVTSKDTLSFLGLTDSVKTILLEELNANGSVKKSLGMLKLSKNYGWVQTYNFYIFPDLYVDGGVLEFEACTTYALSGLSNPMVGQQNLTWKAVFNYSVGDEIHEQTKHTGFSSGGMEGYDKQVVKLVLNKEEIGDTLAYTIKRATKYTIFKSNEPEKTTYSNDTAIFKYFAWQEFDRLPLEPTNDGGGWLTSYTVKSYNRREKYIIGYFSPSFDNCYSPIADAFGHGYYEGIGGGYYDWSGTFSNIDYFHTFVYYKKGAEVWGKPFSWLAEIDENKKANHNISIYPNPAQSQITITSAELLYGQIEILDLLGRVQLTSSLVNQFNRQVDISSLAIGVYVIRIAGDDYEWTGRLVKAE